MKIRRNRLPAVIALCVALLACGSYLLYRAVHVPKVHVAHVAKTWLDTTSGHKHVAVKHVAHKSSKHLAQHHKRHHKQLAHRKHKHKAQLASHSSSSSVQSANYKQSE